MKSSRWLGGALLIIFFAGFLPHVGRSVFSEKLKNHDGAMDLDRLVLRLVPSNDKNSATIEDHSVVAPVSFIDNNQDGVIAMVMVKCFGPKDRDGDGILDALMLEVVDSIDKDKDGLVEQFVLRAGTNDAGDDGLSNYYILEASPTKDGNQDGIADQFVLRRFFFEGAYSAIAD